MAVTLGPATAKNVPIAFTSGAAIFSRIANWLLVPSWVEREGMSSRVKHLRIKNGKLEVGHFAIRSGWKTAQDAAGLRLRQLIIAVLGQ